MDFTCKESIADMARSPINNDVYLKTLKNLHPDPIRENCHLLIEPHLLYLTDEQTQAYLNIVQSDNYANKICNPVANIVDQHLSEIVDTQEKAVSLIELGPGHPDSSLSIAKYSHMRGIDVHYYPIDISEKYLSIAKKVMQPYTHSTTPIHSLFQEAIKKIPNEAYTRKVHVLIGQTFLNFLPEKILPMLCSLASKGGEVILAAEIINQQNSIAQILTAYDHMYSAKFARFPLIHLGVEPPLINYGVDFYQSRVECFYISNQTKSFQIPNDCGKKNTAVLIKEGDKIITAVSYRYTHQLLQKILDEHFSKFSVHTIKDSNLVVVTGFV